MSSATETKTVQLATNSY